MFTITYVFADSGAVVQREYDVPCEDLGATICEALDRDPEICKHEITLYGSATVSIQGSDVFVYVADD